MVAANFIAIHAPPGMPLAEIARELTGKLFPDDKRQRAPWRVDDTLYQLDIANNLWVSAPSDGGIWLVFRYRELRQVAVAAAARFNSEFAARPAAP